MAQPPNSLIQASNGFSTFLKENGYPDRVVWVGRSNLVWGGRRLWIKEPATWDEASRLYTLGVERGFGVCLQAFGKTESSTIATVFVPKDDDESQSWLMPLGGLKMSAWVKSLPAHLVKSNLLWIALSAWYRKSTLSFLDSLEIFAEA
jgi:hypothetical protein